MRDSRDSNLDAEIKYKKDKSKKKANKVTPMPNNEVEMKDGSILPPIINKSTDKSTFIKDNKINSFLDLS